MIYLTENRHPIEWLHDIRKLPKNVRESVAKVIWWDMFASRSVTKRWAHLDKYLKYNHNMPDISKEDMYVYLMKCKYSHIHACRRVGLNPKKHPEYEEKA